MGCICFAIGLAILALAGFFAWKNRNDTSNWIFCIMIGIFFSAFFIILPTEWIKEGKAMSAPTLYTLLSSLFYSFKTLGGRQEISQLETMPLTGLVKMFYIVFNYIVFIAAPVLTSSLLLSFFGDMGAKMQYFFRFSIKSKCYVFSEINENSLALARESKAAPAAKPSYFAAQRKRRRIGWHRQRIWGQSCFISPVKTLRSAGAFPNMNSVLFLPMRITISNWQKRSLPKTAS